MILGRQFFTFVLLLSFICGFAQQQDELQGFQGFSTPKPMQNAGILKVGVTPVFDGQIAFTGELRVTYERKIAKRQSITIGASYDFPNFILLAISSRYGGRGGGRHGGGGYGGGSSFNSFSIEGGRITLGYRYYPLKKLEGLKGLYVGPYLSYNAVNIRQKDISANYEVVNYADATGIVGYQFIFPRRFTLDLFGGLGYKNNFVAHYNSYANEVNNQYTVKIQALDNVKIALQLNFGYAF